MKESTGKIEGIACLCKENGEIFKILQNDLGESYEDLEGGLFVNLFDEKSRAKASSFLIDIQTSQVAFSSSLNLWIDNAMQTLSFLGIKIKEEQIIIIGAESQEDTIAFTNQLQEINNEQANLIRRLMKEKFNSRNHEIQQRDQSYEDLTRLNNELINLQRELSKKNVELERLNETKNRFLGMAAHDLRSPLAIIQGYAAFLKENASEELSEKNRMFLGTISSTTEFMLNLIEDLLDVSKIESGKLVLNKESFDLVHFSKNNVALNQSIAQEKDISVEIK